MVKAEKLRDMDEGHLEDSVPPRAANTGWAKGVGGSVWENLVLLGPGEC